uniref:Uncharacterized protein LOC102804501 n=1 Tax=Saccoglossus kowalevskii TaxID=10224 RepID=A0ABM0MXP1_SACKO|nr:PREDICTED: uncharacterized protein LOC102804501 [Saccoglossus kowalevskii]
MNDLNIPPDRESWSRKISRLATEFIVPVLLPASTVLIVWIGQRYKNIKNNEVHTNPQSKKKDAQLLYLKHRLGYEQKLQIEEEKEVQTILKDLEHIEQHLVQRQDIFCSSFKSKHDRKKVEDALLEYAYDQPYEKDIKLYKGLKKILDENCGDQHCGRNRYENGCLMWEWLDGMRAKVYLRKYQRIYSKMKDWEKSANLSLKG